MKKNLIILCAAVLLSHGAMANVCDHKPTKVIGGVAGSAAAIGVGMKAAGLYAFPHATGMVMLGSTAAGSSAAGTVGIIGGTAGFIGSAGAVLMSPIVIGGAIAVAGGAAAFEGGCYLASK
jgi:hypothetical protein